MKRPRAGRAGGKPELADPKLKARWQDALGRFREARAQGAAGWDAEHELLDEIVNGDPPLYLAGGFKSARAFFAAELPGQDERTVRSHMRVAVYFDSEDIVDYGLSALEALLDYLEAAGGAPLAPAKIALNKQTVAVKEGKTRRKKPFAGLTVTQIKDATRAAQGRARRAPANLSPRGKAARAALDRSGFRQARLRERKGKLELNIALAFADLPKLAKALAAVKPPRD